jgi:hypothetical protein
MELVSVKNNKTVSYNTKTLVITVINHTTNTVYSVTPLEDLEHWDLLVINYFE